MCLHYSLAGFICKCVGVSTQITLLNLSLPAASNVFVTVYELSSDSLACPDGLCKLCHSHVNAHSLHGNITDKRAL